MIGGWFALDQITRIALVYNYQSNMRLHYSSIIETLVLPKKKPVGEDSGLIYNLYLVKFLALSIIQLTNSQLLICITSTLTSFGLLLHLFVRRGTRQSGYLKFPEHTFLAFTFELFSLGLSLSLLFTPSQPALAPFFFITPILTFLIIITSVLNSFRVYSTRIALKPYLVKKDEEEERELDTEEELSER
jgi:hypothetical protein